MWRKETVDTTTLMTNCWKGCVLTCFNQLVILPKSLHGRMEATGRIAMLPENEHVNILFIYRKRPNHFPCCAHLEWPYYLDKSIAGNPISMSTTRQNVRATSFRLTGSDRISLYLLSAGERNGRLPFNFKKIFFMWIQSHTILLCSLLVTIQQFQLSTTIV